MIKVTQIDLLKARNQVIDFLEDHDVQIEQLPNIKLKTSLGGGIQGRYIDEYEIIYILETNETPRATLLHEFLHFLFDRHGHGAAFQEQHQKLFGERYDINNYNYRVAYSKLDTEIEIYY